MLEMPTLKGEMLADRLLDNTRAGKAETMKSAMMAVGYAEATTIAPTRITSTQAFQKRMALNKKFTLLALEKRKREALKRMKETVGKASYRDVTDAVDKMIKNERLISGESTDNVAVKQMIPIIADFAKILEQKGT